MNRLLKFILLPTLLVACRASKNAHELSKEALQQIEAQFELLPAGEPSTEWGSQLLREILLAAPATSDEYRYTFQIIEESSANAFTTPDGHIYMTTGLLLEAESCAEVAGVLGHEVGHVIGHHAIDRLRDTEVAGCAGELIFGSGGRDTFTLGGMILANTAFSREDESEADEIGIKMAAEAGYAPDAIIQVFERLGRNKGNAGFWSTHPANSIRVEAIKALIKTLPSDAQAGRDDCVFSSMTLEMIQERLSE